ncbi:hypothetical protein BXY41_12152 [Lacrimispora xylanisolvens]|uniref:AbiV family abortive infection protein n=1 Tax=Lacrimispora xylanisolvens TaxID=384636 RepID=A0A2S6HCJ4_9FIRM|nr:hypothetical protein [Hungatella xylanolytica]MBE5988709.1 hypothetical protein [Paenibacillaceae bacterium]PPK75146.1 hypothetical protein BXY41_12152 [Hungatella xylanolytica]
MSSQLLDISKSMKEIGLAALASANRHAAFHDGSSPLMNELAIIQAAHAAEIIFKSRIAEEHPLLIFDQLPEYKKGICNPLSIERLLDKGRTIDWNKIPTILWATTGITMPDIDRFVSFGKLRNGLQHFGIMDKSKNALIETLEFVFKVVDPFINNCWNLYAVDNNENTSSLFISSLLLNNIDFLISPSVIQYCEEWEKDLNGEGNFNQKELKRYILARQLNN